MQEERYLWEGARLAQQSKRYADGTQEFFGWHYAPDSFTPLALSHQKNQDEARLLYVVTDHLGTPREVLDGNGRMVWAAQLQTWGKLNRLWQTPAANDADNPLQLDLRFPNQWHDAESGLHYNYQRYYDPESGQYLSPDPIGMVGGMRAQGYVDNPSVWVDPLGLNQCGSLGVGRRGALNQAKRDLGIPISQHPEVINRVPLSDRNGKTILGKNGKPIMTREYTYKLPDRSEVIIQDHSAGHQFGEGGIGFPSTRRVITVSAGHQFGEGGIGDQGAHFNVRPSDNPRTGHVPGTQEHYSF